MKDTLLFPKANKSSKPGQYLFAMNIQKRVAQWMNGFSSYEQLQGAFGVGIMLADGSMANGIGRCRDAAQFEARARNGGITILSAKMVD